MHDKYNFSLRTINSFIFVFLILLKGGLAKQNEILHTT